MGKKEALTQKHMNVSEALKDWDWLVVANRVANEIPLDKLNYGERINIHDMASFKS